MGLFSRCSRNFNAKDRGRGADYFRRRAVEIVSHDAPTLRALVEGSSTYEVRLDWTDARQGLLLASCSCPRFEDVGTCKHVVATLLAADAEGIGDTVPGRGPLDVEPDWDGESDEPDAVESVESDEIDEHVRSDAWTQVVSKTAASQQSVKRVGNEKNRSRPRGTAKWKEQLKLVSQLQEAERRESADLANRRSVKPTQIWYVLDIDGTLERGWPWIKLRQRQTRKDGTPGKLKELKVLRREIARLESNEDRSLISLLIGGERVPDFDSYFDRYDRGIGALTISPAVFDVILPRLCATGRFGWARDDRHESDSQVQPLAWDDGPAWTPALSVVKNDQVDGWEVSATLTRRAEVKPLGAALLIVSAGLVVFEDKISRFDSAGALPWITALGTSGSLCVPAKHAQEFVEMLAVSGSLPSVQLPEELRWAEEQAAPVPHLQIAKSSASWETDLECRLTFEYGQYSAPLESGPAAWYDRQSRRAVRRNLAAERDALQELLKSGAHRAPSYHPSEPARILVTPARMTQLAGHAISLGWQVEASGHRLRTPGEFNLKLASGVDWFDLEATCDFGGVSASLPELLAALRNGEQFITLSDGSQGMLPKDWLARFAGFADLGETKGGRLRFLPSQAALLDALLAAQDSARVSVDQTFALLQKKLRSFDGIQPRVEPDTFVGTLRKYQRGGLGWLHFLDEFGFGGCLADDMGLGKTVQVLALLEGRRAACQPTKRSNKSAHRPSLVVVPRSLIFNWIEEGRRFTPHLRVLDYTGNARASLRDQFNQVDVVVTTYGTLRRDAINLCQIPFDFVILDEAQAIKNASSQVAKTVRLLQARRRLAMTGTPIENHLGELWSLFEFLNPGMLGRNAKLNQLLERNRPMRTGDATEKAAKAELTLLARALRPFMLRRTKQQVLKELPAKTEQTLYCELGDDQRKLYNELRDHYRTTLMQRVQKSGVNKSKIHVLEALLRLRQAACHPGLLDKKAMDAGSAKLDTLLEQLAEVDAEGHKALVFSQFTSLLAIVRRQLDEREVVYEYLDGKTAKRQARVERFQTDPGCRLFLISLKAGGQGLNLTAADYVFILDPWWNPAVEMQAVDRAHRLGQQRHVFAYRLIARGTVEEKILELQQHKRELADAIVSAENSLLRNLTAEDLQLLLS